MSKNISYILDLGVSRTLIIEVGRLGKIRFPKGKYFYVGSGKKNLLKRLDRHKKKDKKIFWHIDYLTTNRFVMINEAELSSRGECELAKGLKVKGFQPVRGFGSSDCRCVSHLFRAEECPASKGLLDEKN